MGIYRWKAGRGVDGKNMGLCQGGAQSCVGGASPGLPNRRWPLSSAASYNVGTHPDWAFFFFLMDRPAGGIDAKVFEIAFFYLPVPTRFVARLFHVIFPLVDENS